MSVPSVGMTDFWPHTWLKLGGVTFVRLTHLELDKSKYVYVSNTSHINA